MTAANGSRGVESACRGKDVGVVMRFKVVIPARYASTRLPAKPLLDSAGKPMVVRVAEWPPRGAEEAAVATDHVEVAAAVERHGLRVLLTRAEHASGTYRLAEVIESSGWHDDTIPWSTCRATSP